MKRQGIQENVLAANVMMIATQKASSSLDSFSGWLAAGFGAAISLFIANISDIYEFSSLESIRCAAYLFVVSAAIAVVNKFAATLIIAGTSSAIEGSAIGERLADKDIAIDSALFFAEIEKGLIGPLRFVAKRAFSNMEAGDFAGPARFYTRASIFQGIGVVIQAILSLAAAVVIIRGLVV